MISTSWSTPLSPGKMGCPSSSSASTQPADQISVDRAGYQDAWIPSPAGRGRMGVLLPMLDV